MEHSRPQAPPFPTARPHCVSCCTSGRPEPVPSGAYCPILFFDIAGFGDPDRDDDVQMFARWGLYRILGKAFDRAGISWDACYHEDRGDGALSVIPPTIPMDRVVALPVWLQAEIRRYNKCASPVARIQLRAALHVGPVHRDEHGISGQAVIHAARLVDAQPAREALAASGADLVFLASESVYESVIRHGPQPMDAAGYRQITAVVKGSAVNAWMTVSGIPDPLGRLESQLRLTSVAEPA
ncbi:hypothetical protein [Actinomadura sp. HBU206391]|uniref:hypothetical protein n=1 Tax=Actinomadura sp. HBU206391 TaxID=2731692 RepID=UPI00164FB365|nr:hypothetical protein [Actinomadura sp. HBU206391]MBC6456808.1 hypothetical protein [Actinomadura sp. HBU206391]